MTDNLSHSGILDQRLADLQRGDPAAADDLIAETYDRLRQLASRILADYPGIRCWEETDDVWQTAAIRFHRALSEAAPESPLHFFRLAAQQIRRTLIELARKFNGPSGLATNHKTNHVGEEFEPISRRHRAAIDDTNDPFKLADWAEFHDQIGRLPDSEREMFDLLWYNGLPQAEAAELLGIDVRNVKRRWRSARLLLQRRRAGEFPG